MKVLHCIYDDPRNPWVAGGASVRAFEIYRRLTDRVEVTIATGSYPAAQDEVVDGVRYVRLGARRPYAWSRLSYAWRATRLLKTAEYDAAIFDYSAYTPILAPRHRRVGFAVHHLTGPTARERWGGLRGALVAMAERTLLRRARRVSLASRAIEPELRRVAGAAMPVEVVGSGVGDEFFELRRHEADYLLFFGRLDIFQKGLDTLLEAFALLSADRPDLRLRMAGRGKDGRAVERLAAELGVAGNVELLGPVSDAERLALLAAARVVLMPSRFEGFGMVAAEAMAAGAPLVASDAGALPDVVDPPRGGLVVPVRDPEALASATAALLDDAERRRALSRSAREAARRYHWDAVAERHYTFLRHVADLTK